jgi:hypothetical protein
MRSGLAMSGILSLNGDIDAPNSGAYGQSFRWEGQVAAALPIASVTVI